jgi:hypothetical protein
MKNNKIRYWLLLVPFSILCFAFIGAMQLIYGGMAFRIVSLTYLFVAVLTFIFNLLEYKLKLNKKRK